MYMYFILSLLIGSGSPNSDDDEQKMNNFIEKGTVFFLYFFFFFFAVHPLIHRLTFFLLKYYLQ